MLQSQTLIEEIAAHRALFFLSVAIPTQTKRQDSGRFVEWAANAVRQRDAPFIPLAMGSISRLHVLSAPGILLGRQQQVSSKGS